MYSVQRVERRRRVDEDAPPDRWRGVEQRDLQLEHIGWFATSSSRRCRRAMQWDDARRAAVEECGELAIGGSLTVAKRPEEQLRHLVAQVVEVGEPFAKHPFAVEGELVHHAHRAAIVGRRDPYLTHGRPFGSHELLGRALSAQRCGDGAGDSLDERGSRSKWHKHGQQRPLVHQQRHLWLPEQRRGEPVAEHGCGLVTVDGSGTLDPVAQLLGSSQHQHGESLSASQSWARLCGAAPPRGPDDSRQTLPEIIASPAYLRRDP